jgi:surfeit locus 1 family protein
MSARLRFVVITLAALALALLTARLGIWQLGRAAEKNALQASIEQQARLPVLGTLPNDTQQPASLVHRRVQLRGRWSTVHTVYLDNRQMNGRQGFFVVTPLLLPDGRALLVQRGWLPRDVNERTRVDDVPSPPGEIVAFARETALRLLPYSVLQTAAADNKLLRDWPAPATGVAKHHGYAFQWFGLSTLVVMLYVWFQLIQPRRARRTDGR